jgi:hypothetical protein
MWYKIVREKDGKIFTLFHGTQGSRLLEPETWYEADQKVVNDGTSKTSYISGFHVLPSYDIAKIYLEKHFKNKENKKIVRCFAGEVTQKAHSKDPVFLARFIYILKGE